MNENDEIIISNCFEKTNEGQKALKVLKKWARFDEEIFYPGETDRTQHALGKRSLILRINKAIEYVRRK